MPVIGIARFGVPDTVCHVGMRCIGFRGDYADEQAQTQCQRKQRSQYSVVHNVDITSSLLFFGRLRTR